MSVRLGVALQYLSSKYSNLQPTLKTLVMVWIEKFMRVPYQGPFSYRIFANDTYIIPTYFSKPRISHTFHYILNHHPVPRDFRYQ